MTEAKIFSCTQSEDLARRIAENFGIPMGNVLFRITATENFNLL